MDGRPVRGSAAYIDVVASAVARGIKATVTVDLDSPAVSPRRILAAVEARSIKLHNVYVDEPSGAQASTAVHMPQLLVRVRGASSSVTDNRARADAAGGAKAEISVGRAVFEAVARSVRADTSASYIVAAISQETLREFLEYVGVSDAFGADFGKLLEDATTADDAVMVSISRVSEDTAQADDVFLITFDKVAADSVTTLEDQVFDFNKALSDSPVTGDALLVDFAKALADTFSAIDAAAVDFTKVIHHPAHTAVLNGDLLLNGGILNGSDDSDSVIVGDFARVSVEPVYADGVTATQSAAVFDFSKAVTDAAAATEATAVDFVRGITAESATASDAASIDVGKAATDSASTADVLIVDFGKVASELVSAGETAAVDFAMGSAADIATAADSFAFLKEIAPVIINAVGTSLLNGGATSLAFDFIGTLNGQVLHASNVGDDLAVSDSLPVFDFSKAATDAVTGSDSLSVNFEISKTDAATVADANAFDVGKALTEAATATDSPAVSFDKGTVPEGASATDAPVVAFGKASSDSATATDGTPVMSVSKADSESATATDAPAISVSKGGLSDTATATDSLSISFEKAATESVTAAETAAPVLDELSRVLNGQQINSIALN